jgi:imidazolonepropionase-like amidohydrolase
MSSIVLPVMRQERLIPRAVRTLHAQGSDAVVYRWTPATAQIAVIPRGDTSRRERALLTRVAEEVHITGLPLVVEAGCLDGAAAAIASGARVIVDVWSDTLDTAFLRDAADAGVFYGTSIVAVQNELRLLDAIATRQRLSIDDPLAVLDSVTAMHLSRASEWPLSHDEPTRLRTMRSRLQQHLDRLRSNLVAAHRAGLRLVAASGAGRALTLHGTALNTELEAWQACGIPPGAILRAATVDAADAWPALERRGRLDAGAVADVLILHEDPSRDIHNLRRLDAVVRGGELRWQRESTTTAVDD